MLESSLVSYFFLIDLALLGHYENSPNAVYNYKPLKLL